MGYYRDHPGDLARDLARFAGGFAKWLGWCLIAIVFLLIVAAALMVSPLFWLGVAVASAYFTMRNR